MRSRRLIVGNISHSVTNEQLKKLFSYYGGVKRVSIIEGRGFGFVEMSSPSEAEIAKEELNGYEFKGLALRVDEARPQKKDIP